jgi:hypothetical protein
MEEAASAPAPAVAAAAGGPALCVEVVSVSVPPAECAAWRRVRHAGITGARGGAGMTAREETRLSLSFVTCFTVASQQRRLTCAGAPPGTSPQCGFSCLTDRSKWCARERRASSPVARNRVVLRSVCGRGAPHQR